MSTHDIVAEEATRNVIIGAEQGLDPRLARQIRARVMAYGCTATIHSAGIIADANSILQLLMLGAPRGTHVSVRCVGLGAEAACARVAATLEGAVS